MLLDDYFSVVFRKNVISINRIVLIKEMFKFRLKLGCQQGFSN